MLSASDNGATEVGRKLGPWRMRAGTMSNRFSGTKEISEDETHFANVDIRVDSNRDLSVLVSALGKTVIVNYLDRLGHRAVFSLWPHPKTPSTAVTRFSRLLSQLPPRVRGLWRTATVKELDIGIQAGTSPLAAEWTLSKAAVEEAARIGARIRLTIYAPDQGFSAVDPQVQSD